MRPTLEQRYENGNADARPHDPTNGFKLKVAETIGNPECPLMVRWVLETPVGSLRLHHFLRSDYDRELHDHPWWFVTIPLTSGGYVDETFCTFCGGRGRYLPATNRDCPRCVGVGRLFSLVPAWWPTLRRAGHKHAVRLLSDKPIWSVVVTGRKSHEWGFWDVVGGVFEESRAFFRRVGHAACQD